MAAGKNAAATLGVWLVFEDEAGFSMTPPTARTWAPCGPTPIVRVRGRTTRRVSMAALTCYRPGQRSRLIRRPYRHDRTTTGRKSFAWIDYRDSLIGAQRQLGGPIVVVRDNLNTRLTAGMRKFVAAHDWLRIYQLPTYAPDLNPVEGIWSLLRRGRLANRILTDPDHLARIVRDDLHRLKYHPPPRRRLPHRHRPHTQTIMTTSQIQPL
nr:transposase [Nocardia panacis]